MRARFLTTAAAVVPALTLAIAGGPAATAASAAPARPITTVASPAHHRAAPPVPVKAEHVCGARRVAGRDQCLALLRVAPDGKPLVSTGVTPSQLPFGYGPKQLQSAYQLAVAAASRGGSQTVAVVDAYDDPNAETDLNAYRAEYGLPPCTSASGCFRKVNQDGAASPVPAADASWALEESLDIEMVSAACPRCHIVLAEASDNSDTNVAATVASAAKLGATEISNSYGEPEYRGETKLEPFYDQPGVQVTASAGDAGYGVSYPAASAHVTAVGGTSLWPAAGGRGWRERAWAGTGSGCSTQVGKPAWQHDSCTHRMDDDVAAVASENTPVAVYDTYGVGGWVEVAGTSVASPIVAAVYALAGDPRSPGGSYFYHHRDRVFDVTSGANGFCSPAYLCTARPGYDGPTGLGTPDLTGVSAGNGGSCAGHWSAAPAQPGPPSRAEVLDGLVTINFTAGVAALSPASVWTAGWYESFDGSAPAGAVGDLTRIEHWNGSKWSHSPSPDPTSATGSSFTRLTGLSFDRPDDGWTAGYFSNGAIGAFPQFTPEVAHWNGSRWSLSPVLTPMSTYLDRNGATEAADARPEAVSALSPHNVWIAGLVEDTNAPAPSVTGAFVEHWDGRTWQVAHSPLFGQVAITAMDAISGTDIWAAGVAMNGSGLATLHWDGHSWSLVKAPHPADAEVTAVSASSPGNVWLAGEAYIPSLARYGPFALHWNGHAWSISPVAQPPALPGSKGNQFGGVTAISASDVWASGRYVGRRAGQREAGLFLLEHWNGHHWSIVPTPQPAVPGGLGAASASSPANVWIAGGQQVDALSSGFANSPYNLHLGCRRG